MHLTLLLLSITTAPAAALPRIADDVTVSRAIERSQQLADELLTVLPDATRQSPRPRVQAKLDDFRRDRERVGRDGRNAVFEAAVFANYSRLCQWAEEYLGDNRVHFQPVRDTSRFEFSGINGGGQRSRAARVAFADTLFSFDDLQAIGQRAAEMIQTLAKHEKADAYQNARWKRELATLRDEAQQAVEALRMPSQLNKVIPEAKLLGAYSRIVGLTVNLNR